MLKEEKNSLPVSAIITTYNGLSRGYISKAIDSVLYQTKSTQNFIIIDDGSTDETATFIKKTYPDIQLIQTDNLGISSARNTGITSTSSEFICFLDDDDEWLPNKIEEQYRAITQSNDIGMVFCSVIEIDKNGYGCKIRTANTSRTTFPEILSGNPVLGPSSVMVRRSALLKTNLFCHELKQAEDYDLWINLSKVSKIKYIHRPLSKYRIHDSQESSHRIRIEKKTIDVINSHATFQTKKYLIRYVYGRLFRSLISGELGFSYYLSSAIVKNKWYSYQIITQLIWILLSLTKKTQRTWENFELYLLSKIA